MEWLTGFLAGRLLTSARPRGGDWLQVDLAYWQRYGATDILCLLTQPELEELDLDQEARVCQELGLHWRHFPIRDRHVPTSLEEAYRQARHCANRLQAGAAIIVHCRMGLGRSTLMASAIMALGGISPRQALRQIGDSRRLPVPDTSAQRDWIFAFARQYGISQMIKATDNSRNPFAGDK